MRKEIVSQQVTKRAFKKTCKMMKRAKDKRAKPKWYSHPHFLNMVKDLDEIENMSIDHIIPINHTKVCGLHVQDNWQLMGIEDNSSKSNKLRVRRIEELTMFELYRKGKTDKIPKDYLNRIIK